VAEPISLNKARKARAKAEAEVRAAENRVRFGRAKAEKDLAKAVQAKARRDIEAGKRDKTPDR